MGRYAWDLFSDPTYIRDRLRDEYADDEADRELVDNPDAQLAAELEEEQA